MVKHVTASVLVFLSMIAAGLGQGIRQPVWSGQFYPENPEQLADQVNSFLNRAEKVSFPPQEIKVLIVPHAGYIYSGSIAAAAYRSVMNMGFDSVVIIGPSHRFGFRGCSVYTKGGYKTPLGILRVDEDLARSISKKTGYHYIPRAHREEHSIEVQIPFVQIALPQAKVVPIVMGMPEEKTIETLASALSDSLSGKKALVIASTDMSHFYDKKKANEVDRQTISLIEELNTDALSEKLEKRENIMCGGGAVVASLLYVRKTGHPRVHVLAYGDSSRFGGSDRVVGYFAGAVCDTREQQKFSLSSEEKEALLQMARLAVNEYVLHKKIVSFTTDNRRLLTKCGAFVTLKKRGRLRGCIGFIEAAAPLYQTVIQAAVYAASRDNRFPPVGPEELKDMGIEISVLTPLKRITNPARVQVGKHGLVLVQGNKKGLLLPQVALEQNWTRDVFLSRTCLKAGLPADAWKRGAEIYVFEAIVFH